MEVLVAENITMQFGGLRALDRVSFSVEAGERLAIIGPNGAGKTTLFQILSGLVMPTSGRIFFQGRDITRLPAHRRASLALGRTFQITNLFFNLTVLDNLLLALEVRDGKRFNLLRPLSTYRDLFDEGERILNKWGMWERRNEPVKSLSYGEQRQLEIMLTLSQERPLLLLDEPTCGLSPEEAQTFVSMICNFSQDFTTLIIDHDMDVIFGVAKKVMVLHYGRLLIFGSPEEVRQNSEVQRIYMGACDEPA